MAAAKALNDVRFVAGLEGYKFLVGPAKPKKEYKDKQATGHIESVRVDLISQELGTINLDLVPYSDEKLNQVISLFGQMVTTENLIKVTGFKTSTMESNFYVTVTAEDIAIVDID